MSLIADVSNFFAAEDSTLSALFFVGIQVFLLTHFVLLAMRLTALYPFGAVSSDRDFKTTPPCIFFLYLSRSCSIICSKPELFDSVRQLKQIVLCNSAIVCVSKRVTNRTVPEDCIFFTCVTDRCDHSVSMSPFPP